MMAKKRSAKQVTFGQGKKREQEKKAKKVKEAKAPKAKKDKKAKAKSEAVPVKRKVSAELAEVELEICDLACDIDQLSDRLKSLKSQYADKVTLRQRLRNDDVHGQSRMSFSKPVEEYHQHLPEVHTPPAANASEIPDAMWKQCGLIELGLPEVVLGKLNGADLHSMGDVADWQKKLGNYLDKLLAPGQMKKYEDATEKVFANIRSRMTDVAAPPCDEPADAEANEPVEAVA